MRHECRRACRMASAQVKPAASSQAWPSSTVRSAQSKRSGSTSTTIPATPRAAPRKPRRPTFSPTIQESGTIQSMVV